MNSLAELEPLAPRRGLYPFQRQVLHDLLDAVWDANLIDRRIVAHLPTGAGKTRIASHAASALMSRRESEGGVFVWLAASEELCEQAAQNLAAAWRAVGNRPMTLYRYWDTASVDITRLEDAFLVASIRKLWSAVSSAVRKGEPGLLADFSRRVAGVVFDEAHQAIAPTYRAVTDHLVTYNPPLIGLTATPGRTFRLDGNDYDLAEMFGERKVTIDPRGHGDPVTYLIREGYLAEPEFVNVPTDLGCVVTEPTDGSDYSDSDLGAIGRDDAWIARMQALASQAIARHDRVIVFCPSVESAERAAEAFASNGHRSAAIVAGTRTEERRAAIDAFRDDDKSPMVLFNYGVLIAGFDAPRTRCVIVARPTNSLVLYSQMVGRAMRGPRSGGNRRCQIYTVTDTSLPGFGSVTGAFENWEALWRPINN